jgi:hypothetical protein
MDKRHLHHIWAKIRSIRYRYLLVAFAVFAVISVLALRQNNLNALRLRDHVLEVDKSNGDTEKALRELREYVYSHMNADLSSGGGLQQPVQLKYRYDRLVKAEKARVDKSNESIYTKAQHHCEPLYTQGFLAQRVKCITAYLDKYGNKQNSIPDALYKFDFVAPLWSPDLAGFSILLAVVCLLLLASRFIAERWFKFELDQ